jgi:hypothetical protein
LCDARLVEITRDEDEARAVIAIGPGIEQHRRVEQVLDTVNHRWRLPARDVEQAFDPQKIADN